MPGKVKVKIISGKNLPVMDRSSDTTDAYVEIKLGTTTYKTDVCRRTLHPQWNTDWYRFEVDDSELQDEPLQIRLMDHDTYSANDAIGKVYLNLNPLLLPVAGQLALGDNNPHHEMSGWIPVYDTMHGIRGEVNVTVKVELFSDFNRYRQSSCGVHFFYSPTVPHGYYAKIINGFVEELIVDDDPEYQWIDKIRTPRASNEARQTLFFKLSGELQRKIGVKALSLGGNAVIGYRQCFDLEGESGIVARGIGTAVTLVKAYNVHPVLAEPKEEDIEGYLKFVGDGKSFSLCSTSPSHKSHFPLCNPFLHPNTSSLTPRFPKVKRGFVSLDYDVLSPSVSNPNLHDRESNIKVLLNQEDRRGKSAMSRRFQKFKHSQKSLSKKMIALKAKLNDSIGEESDEGGLDKRKFFKRTASDSSAMAEILARSVMRATTSLSCILEDQPNSLTEDETMKKLEPVAKLLVQSESENNEIPSDAQSCSSTDSSTSGSDYEYKDYNKPNNDVETISNIITNVERLQRCLSREGLHKQYSLPAIPTKGFSLSSLDNLHQFEMINKSSLIESVPSVSSSISNLSEFDQTVKRERLNQERRCSDTFDSRISEKARSSNNSRRLKRFDEMDLEDEDYQCISSYDANNEEKPNDSPVPLSLSNGNQFQFPSVDPHWSSNENKAERNTMVGTALQTILFERANLLGTPDSELKKEPNFQSNEQESKGLVKVALPTVHTEQVCSLGTSPSNKNIGAASAHHSDESKGIIKTALQTMLIERADLLGSPEVPVATAEECHGHHLKKEHKDHDPKGIVKTALQTILIERADLLGTSEVPLAENKTGAEVHEEKISHEPHGIVKTALETMLAERANMLGSGVEAVTSSVVTEHQSNPPIQGTSEDINILVPISLENINVEHNKIVKTAIQTMLLEKFNLLGTYSPPTSPSSSHSGQAGSFSFHEADTKIKSIPKSSSAASFREHQKQKETVLGMPFTSLSSLITEYDKEIKQLQPNFLSDTHLHQFKPDNFKTQGNARKKCLKFLSSKSEHAKHGMFHKFRRASKKSLAEDVEKEHHQNILSRMFHHRHDEKYIKDKGTQTSNEALESLKVSQTPTINSSPNRLCKTKISIDSLKPPGQTDLASGDFIAHSKTKSACLTSHHSSPAQEKQDQTGGDIKDQHTQDPPGIRTTHSPVKVNYMDPLHRRSSDSDLSITPKGNSLSGSDKSMGNAAAYFMRNHYIRRGQLNQEHLDMLEYPFLTMTKFPPRFIIQIGGSISARSVKLLERILNVDEPESRDIWWSEIRMEIRSHARSLNCNAVLGYTELTSICDDVCVLSACGTAAVIDFNSSSGEDDNFSNVQLIHKNVERDKCVNGHHRVAHESPEHRIHPIITCYTTHLPYDEKAVPLKAKVSKCPMCLQGKVPEVLIATIEPPESVPSIGKGCFIESHVSRALKDVKGETTAKEISDGLPFLEYELHRLLVNKLKIKGMNAIFSLKTRITIGEKMLVGVATGTAIYLPCLPSPELPVLVTDKSSDEKLVADLQEMLHQTMQKNKEIYQIKDDNQNKYVSDEDSDEEQATLDITCGNKDCCILELDDPEDAEVLRLLMQEKVPEGFHVVSTESVPGLEDLEIVKNLQMFTQIYRAKLVPPYNLQKHFVRLLQSVYFKLRRMVPCALCDLQFRIDVPEPDEIQLCVIGMALGLGKKVKKSKSAIISKKPEEDLIFKLDDDQNSQPAGTAVTTSHVTKPSPFTLKFKSHRSPSKYKTQSIKQRHFPYNERHGVDITPLSYVPGGRIEQYLGNLNFFFIRETTSIREEGGLSGFIHSFITEVLAIVRSHVTALGGNALVAFFMTECILNHNLHKNQGQCLINVGGDVVSVSYYKDDR